MHPPPDVRWPRLVAGFAALGALVALAMTPLYFLAEAENRPMLVRAGAGAVLALVLLRLRAIVGGVVGAIPESASGAATDRAPAPAVLDPAFRRLDDEIRQSVRSHRYFEHILWPRLVALDRRRPPGSPADRPKKPSSPRRFGRGPQLTALREAIAALERRP